MKAKGHAFDGARTYDYTDWRLHITAGSGRWFPEFTPINFIAVRFMFVLLKHLSRHNICCHVGGSFPTYLAGVQTKFHRVKIFIALKYAP